MLKKIGLLGLVPLSITSCWTPEYDAEFNEVSDGIYKEYNYEIEHMLNSLDDNSLVSLLVAEKGVEASANHAFKSTYGIEHFINGTGFIIHEDDTGYYVATNFHVIEGYLNDPVKHHIIVSKANELDNLSGGNKYNSIIDFPEYDVDSDRAIVYGDDVLFDGEGVNWDFPASQGHLKLGTPTRKIDLAVVRVPKSAGDYGFDDGYEAVKLAKPFNFDFEEDSQWINNKTWTGYTVGFPAGYKRKNKGITGELQLLAGHRINDAANGSLLTIDDTEYWQQNWYYQFYQAGGSSGSPIVNQNGELITLLASGYTWNGVEYTGGVSLSEVNAAICNAQELLPIIDAGHCEI